MTNKFFKEFIGTERFLIKRKVGEGSFGDVYQAYDQEKNIEIAIKVLRKIDSVTLYRFKKEFRSLVGINHPNLVKLYELISVDENYFFTMEFINGVNFLEYVWEMPAFKQENTFSILKESLLPENGNELKEDKDFLPPFLNIERLRSAIKQLIEGVYALHNLGKLHRDIKPSNVLVTKEGRVVLLDFGFVVDLEPAEIYKSVDNHIVGTIAYMSPEQSVSSRVTEASDWYSIGVMLYEALTGGKLPFDGNAFKILKDKQEITPLPPCKFAPYIPEDLNSLCVELLKRNPQERPTGSKIIQLVSVDTSRIKKTHSLSSKHISPFIGRKKYLDVLVDAFNTTKHGRAVTVHVKGPPGIGKSTLIRHFLDDLIKQDLAIVLTGRCYEEESVPYKALDSLIDALTRYLMTLTSLEVEVFMPRDIAALTRIFPVLERVDAISYAPRRVLEIPCPQELRRKASTALRELLARMADRKPLILFIDDLQWGDIDSISLIGDLIRPPDPPALLLILAYRNEDEQNNPILNSLNQYKIHIDSASEIRELLIEEFTDVEVEELVMALLSDKNLFSNYMVDKVIKEVGGNPYFIGELVKYIENEPTFSKDFLSTGEINLTDLIWKRILQLPKEFRYLLEIIAISGRPIKKTLLHYVTKLDVKEFEEGIFILKSENFIRTSPLQEGEEIETYHDYIRKTIISHLSQEELKSYHYSLASALENFGKVDPEILADHFLKGEAQEKAVEYVTLSAKQASEALAFNKAASLYQLALSLYKGEDSKKQTMLIKLGDALSKIGKGVDAACAYMLASQNLNSPEAIELKAKAGVEFLRSGHTEKGIKLLYTVLNEIGMKLAKSPYHAIFSLLWRRLYLRIRGLKFKERTISEISPKDITTLDICWFSVIGLAPIDRLRAAELHLRSLLLALKVGEPYRIARTLAIESNSEASIDAILGYSDSKYAQKLIETAKRIAERINHPHALALVAGASAVNAFWLGDWKTTFEKCEVAEKILRDFCTGVAWEINLVQLISIVALFYLGQIKELYQRISILIKEAEDRKDILSSATLRIELVHLLLAEDNVKNAQQVLSEVMRENLQSNYLQNIHFIIAQSHIFLYQGDKKSAWEYIIKEWPIIKRTFSLRIQQLRIHLLDLKARCALALASGYSNKTPFLKSAKNDAKRIEKEKRNWSNPLASLIYAAIANLQGDKEISLNFLKSAIKGFENANMSLHKEIARRRYGELLGGEEGKAIVYEVDEWMQEQKIKNPKKMTALFIPGFDNLP